MSLTARSSDPGPDKAAPCTPQAATAPVSGAGISQAAVAPAPEPVQATPFKLSGRADLPTLVHALSPLFWVPQAFLLALAVHYLQAGQGFTAMLLPAAGIFVCGLLRTATETWAAARLHDNARQQLGQWREHAVAVLAARSPLDRDRMPAGTAASVLAEQTEAILPWLTRFQAAMWRVRVVPLLLLLPVLWLSWMSAVVLLVAAPLIPLFMAIVGWRAKEAAEKQWLQLGDMNGFLLDRLRGLPTLRALGAVRSTASRLRASAEDLRTRTMRVLRIAFLSSAVLELFSALGVAMVAVYIGFHMLGQLNFGSWGGKLSLSEGLFILLLAPNFFEPLRELAVSWHDRAAGEAAIDALQALSVDGIDLPDAGLLPVSSGRFAPKKPDEAPEKALDNIPSKTSEASAAHTPAAAALGKTSPPAIHVQGLSFTFPGASQPLFEQLQFAIAPGEKVALTGKSGSGKTVLLSLLAGLLPASEGTIFVDNTALTPRSLPALRGRMAWMGQHAHVFAASVADNIVLGRGLVSREQVLQAIRLAHLEHVAQAHPGVSLGEGGGGLSGGEIARLALARLAFAREADILLLDEPTAHLDSETAQIIREALVQLMQNRTVIVATHDPLLAQQMDRVLSVEALLEGGGANG